MRFFYFIKKGISITIIMVSLVVIPCSSQSYEDNADLYYQLKEIGITVDHIKGFKITYSRNNNIIAKRHKEIIKVKVFSNFDRSMAEKYIRRQIVLLNGLFEPQLPPYPEFLTKETGCKDKYKPVRKNNLYGEYYLLYAGKRLGYGICTDDLIEYRASLGFYYCHNNDTLFKIEYFIPSDEELDKLIYLNESFNCKP